MPLPFVDALRSWTARRKNLLRGVVGVAVRTAASCVPVVGGLAGELLGELAAHGVERLSDAGVDLADLKPAGDAFSGDELEQINAWLESLQDSYGELLDLLDERLPKGSENEGIAKLTERIEKALEGDDKLAGKFDKCLKQVRKQTLSLRRIEAKLDEHFHVQQQLWASLEEIKALFVQAPSLAEWAELRRARPEAVAAVRAADEHFLAGRRDQGVQVLFALLRQRGVGEATLLRQVGGRAAAHGALAALTKVLHAQGAHDTALGRSLTGLTAKSAQTGGLKVWRTLPRGLVLNDDYRIEEEIGRGGMASVYKATGVGLLTEGGVFAIKVPAAELLAESESLKRFVREVNLVKQFSGSAHHSAIVQMIGHVTFTDPFDRSKRIGLVLEHIDGVSLARFLEIREQNGKDLTLKEVLHIMDGVCQALTHAHKQKVLHRDVKPQNVMMTDKGVVKLMDFGIARLLDGGLNDITQTGQMVGTPGYMAPEGTARAPRFSERSDVYHLGTMLRHLLTFDVQGDVPAKRPDCPEAWLDLIDDAQQAHERRRPASVAVFHQRLRDGLVKPEPPLPGEIVNAIGMKFVRLPAGKFLMGSPENEAERRADERQHEVEIGRPLYLAVYQVTQAQYQRVIDNNPSHFSGADHPVEQVTWDEAVAFCQKLSEMPEEKQKKRLYRLPTEAEWEYACRGGAASSTPVHFGASLSSIQANFNGDHPYGGASKGPNLQRTCPVGHYPANGFGLFDMHGNVWEWCSDWHDKNYYASSLSKDPTSPTTGTRRVLRGGAWNNVAAFCRSACRGNDVPGARNFDCGFRVVLLLPA